MDPMSMITQFRFPNGLVHCAIQGRVLFSREDMTCGYNSRAGTIKGFTVYVVK